MTAEPFQRLKNGLAAGDESAFGELYDLFSGRMYRAAVRLLGNAADAEDVVHEVFLALFRGRSRLAGVRDLEAYVFMSLHHGLSRRRRNMSNAPAELAEDVEAPRVELGPDDELEAALRRLPDPQREAITLKIDGQLTFAQIAEVIGISPNTAASRYREGLRKLKDMLEPRS